DERLNSRNVGHICLDDLTFAACLYDLLQRFRGRLLVAVVVDGHRGTGRSKPETDRMADAAIATGHNCHFGPQQHATSSHSEKTEPVHRIVCRDHRSGPRHTGNTPETLHETARGVEHCNAYV